MKTRGMVLAVVVGTFSIMIVTSAIFAYTRTDALTETRKSALINTLTQGQIRELGAFHCYDNPWGSGSFWSERYYVSELSTSDALMVLMLLNASNRADIDRAIEYLAGKQYQKNTGAGGYGAYFNSQGTFLGCDLHSTYKVARTLNQFGSLDFINKSLLIDFVTRRYNESIGAFHELITNVDGKDYAISRFPMVFRSFKGDIAYAIPNIITTCSGICTLQEIGRLDLINTTKVTDWIIHCQAENAMFKPYPEASYMPMPDWSPLKTNPFEVDRYGAGVPYTFAAISALEALGQLNTISVEDRLKIRDYIVACQGNITGTISVHQDYFDPHPSYTYEAILTLHYLGMLDEAEEAVMKIVTYFQKIQTLHLDDSWPIPYPGDIKHPNDFITETSDRYGLHYGDTGPPTDSYYAVAVFKVTRNLHLLDQPTPRVYVTRVNLVGFSALVTAVTTIAVLAVLTIHKRRLKLKSSKAPESQTPQENMSEAK